MNQEQIEREGIWENFHFFVSLAFSVAEYAHYQN